MDDAWDSALCRVFKVVLERQAFMFAEPAGLEDISSAKGPFMAATIGFSGEIGGRLTLAVSKSLMPEIASNYLGMDADDPFVEARSGDACKELLNVTCGHLLTTMRGEEPVFELTTPALSEVAAGTMAEWAGRPGSVILNVEGGLVLLRADIVTEAGAVSAGSGRERP